ncbi:MAG: ATP-dependent DNA ligase [Verrucomicrobia bacterium]|nr:ATP-dependent DNA ligase [Verrucomicrobiota bacterium]
MALLDIRFVRGGVHLPELGLWLDPHEPQLGADKVFISHAHSDHVGVHREVILTAATSRLMRARLSGEWQEHLLGFGEQARFEKASTPFALTLLSAGHIFGSAMAWIEAQGGTLLYTGDFKLRPGLSAEPCQPRTADVLIMETTYGRPQYRFPPATDVLKGVVRFCREALDNDETPVLLGYSLGKSQEILRGLAEAGLPIMLHGQVHKLTEIYKEFGQTFPAYEKFESTAARKKVLVCPPSAANSTMLQKLRPVRTAILTGWAVDANCRFRYRADAAFALSDHADFPDLIEMVKRVNPKKVYTLHGFAADFAQTLREMGCDAEALSQEEQLTLPLPPRSRSTDSESATANRSIIPGPWSAESKPEVELPLADRLAEAPAVPSDRFHAFASVCASIAATTKKSEKTRLLAEYEKRLETEWLVPVNTWLTGHPFAPSQNKVLQLGWAIIRDALCAVNQMDQAEFGQVYLKHSDLGETAFEILREIAPAVSTFAVRDVETLFQQLYAARGPLGKLPILIAALRRVTALEGKFLTKILTGDLRIGLKEGLVEEAIAQAFSVAVEEVKNANLLLGDIGETARLAQRGQLASATLTPFRPVKYMLASPEETAEAIWDRVKSRAGILPAPADALSTTKSPDRQDACPTLVWVEDKYDGIRCQVHKVGDRVALYSRDLKEITASFPELADLARTVPDDFVLDGEIVAMREGRAMAFADLQRRLGRREGDLFLGAEIPVQFVAFDLLWFAGESRLNAPLRKRREQLEKLSRLPLPMNRVGTRSTASLESASADGSKKSGTEWNPSLPGSWRLSQITAVRSSNEIEAAFDSARERGNEGLVIKDPDSVYSPGRRGLAWLKLKKAYGTLDCVVIGAEYGHGKRRAVLSDYTFAVRDDKTGQLRTIGKAYSGLTDAEIAQLTEHFLSKAISQRGRYFEVEPDTVLEIAFDALQPSARHSSGLAMRFPRILRIRRDKSPAEIDTVSSARRFLK